MTFEIRVKPRARQDKVGGGWGPSKALVVAVRAPAVDGEANAAVSEALAAALGVKARQVRIVSGATHRSKIVEVIDPPPTFAATLAALRGQAVFIQTVFIQTVFIQTVFIQTVFMQMVFVQGRRVW